MPATNTASYARHSILLMLFHRFSARVSRWARSPLAFMTAFGRVVF